VTWFLIFVSMFLVELPDKTSIATLSLVSRHKASSVWMGSAAAMVAQTILAVSAGRLLSQVPKTPLRWLEIVLFMAFAMWLWRESKEPEEQDAGSAARKRPATPLGASGQAFVVVFLAEFLDLTQIATMTYASRFPHQMLRLFFVVALALVSANSAVVFGGQKLSQVISPKWIQRAAALLFLALSCYGIGTQVL